MINRCIAFKTITSIACVATILLTYAFMVEKGQITISDDSQVHYQVANLFYLALTVFIAISLLFLISKRMITIFGSSNRDSGSKSNQFLNKFTIWLDGLHSSINILFMSIVAHVGFINSESGLNLSNFSFVLYLGPIAIGIALMGLAYIIFNRN